MLDRLEDLEHKFRQLLALPLIQKAMAEQAETLKVPDPVPDGNEAVAEEESSDQADPPSPPDRSPSAGPQPAVRV